MQHAGFVKHRIAKAARMDPTATVLILTPMKSAASHLDSYFAGLERLDYPHHLLSLGILEGDSDDDTYSQLQRRLAGGFAGFAGITLAKKDFGFRIPPGVPRWTAGLQPARRAVLARARNHLLFRALADQDWVLWLDADIVAYPPGIIQRLLAANRDIVQPNCVTAPGGESFDRNAWSDGGARHLSDRRGEGLVRLQSVGGTMLLVRADLHRDGLIFPPFFYGGRSPWVRDPHPLRAGLVGEIETEGLAIMAKDMGAECWGLPDLEIFHAAG
jgi:peptide chain release factor subunit 1